MFSRLSDRAFAIAGIKQSDVYDFGYKSGSDWLIN